MLVIGDDASDEYMFTAAEDYAGACVDRDWGWPKYQCLVPSLSLAFLCIDRPTQPPSLATHSQVPGSRGAGVQLHGGEEAVAGPRVRERRGGSAQPPQLPRPLLQGLCVGQWACGCAYAVY